MSKLRNRKNKLLNLSVFVLSFYYIFLVVYTSQPEHHSCIIPQNSTGRQASVKDASSGTNHDDCFSCKLLEQLKNTVTSANNSINHIFNQTLVQVKQKVVHELFTFIKKQKSRAPPF